MANLTSTLTVRLLDKVSGPARAASAALLGIGNSVAMANRRGMIGISGRLDRMSKVANVAATRITALGSATRGAALPLGIFGGLGAKAVYDFAKMANAVQAVTNITDKQKSSLQNYVTVLNKLFPFMNKEIMSAAFELGRAGFNFEQIMGALKGTLNLALAGDIQLQEASDIATNVLTAMRLPMRTTEQAAASLTRVNDALAYASANSNTDVRLLGETFKYVGPMAAAAGLSINEVAAASMVMARNGIRGSEAGVALRSALVRMVKPTSFMNQALERLNINLKDYVKSGKAISAQDVVRSLSVEGINAKPFASQIEAALKDPRLKGSLGKLTQRITEILGASGVMNKSKLAETINETLTAAGSQIDFFGFIRALKEKGANLGDIARIFDARQGSRLITLLAGDLNRTLHQIESDARGATQRMSDTRMKGIVGIWARHGAAWENLALKIAESGVLATVSGALEGLTSGIDALAKMSPRLLEFSTYAAMALAAAPAIAVVGTSVAKIVGGILKLGALAGVLGAGRGAATAAAGAEVGAGTAAAAGAGAGVAAARRGIMSGLLGRLGLAMGAWNLIQTIADSDARLRSIGIETRPEAIEAMKRQGERMDRIKAAIAATAGDSRAPASSGPPSVPSVPNVAGKLGQPEAAAVAGRETVEAYKREILNGLKDAAPEIQREAARILQGMRISPQITVTPRIDGGALRGTHGDIGVDVTR